MKKLFATLLLFGFIIALVPTPNVIAISTSQVYTVTNDDGYINKQGSSYSSIWSASSGDTNDSSSVGMMVGQVKVVTIYLISRTYLFFDTSSIPDTEEINITEAKISIYIYADYSDSDFNITVQNGQPTYPHEPAWLSDYNKAYYSGDGGKLSTTGIGTGYKNITLNADGISWVSKTGTTKLCLRNDKEVAGTGPTGNEYVSFYCYEKGESYEAKLYITYEYLPNHYIIHGPFYENGNVANELIEVTVVHPYNATESFYLNGTDGIADTHNLYSNYPPNYMRWNVSTTSNLTRFYYFTDVSFDEVWVFVPDLTQPFYVYEFTITDFVGMTNPYLETVINLNGTTRTVERKSLATVGTISFIMQQWDRYGLRFRCDQGMYTLYFEAGTTSSTNLQVLSGAFPTTNYASGVIAWARRINSTIIEVTYSNSKLDTTWLYVQITHKAYGSTIIDYTENQTAVNSYLYDWPNAEDGVDYSVEVQAYTTQLYVWQLTALNPVDTTNIWTGLFEALGTFPGGFAPEQIPAAIIILVVLGVFSYGSTATGCVAAWIVAGVMVLIRWYTIALPTFGFAGFMSFLIAYAESKKTEREL